MHFTLESAFSAGALVGHAGYILLILSMLMTRMTWLRIVAVGAGILQALYYGVWLNDPVGTFWETLFVLTNIGQLTLIYYRNSMARFTPDERAFYEIAVPTLEPADARRLIRAGRWVDAPPGAELAREGELVPDLAFIVAGDIDIKVGGQTVGRVGPGSFVGEISVSSGGPATATAVAKSPVRYLAFERGFLGKLLDKSDEIGRAVELAFRLGLRDKLIRTNAAMAAASGPLTP
jgi:hypothetical protein